MSHVKAGGTAKNVHDSPGQRLGVKLFGGQKVKVGQVIVRQVGMTKRPGVGTSMSRNFTIHAARDGVVNYNQRKVRTFSGRSVRRTEVTVDVV
jgi:large subunit ribosomal protein L27